MTPRTSQSHPLRIDQVSCRPAAPGVIGITFCPGKCGDSIFGAPWQRDLDSDLDAVKSWGASMALTLIEDHEFDLLRVRGLGAGLRQRGIEWHHLPIADLCAPDEVFNDLWLSSGAAAVHVLRAGGKVLVHCRGGLGRAGMVACVLLIELGASSQEALQQVRRARPRAVETAAQERYLYSYAPPERR